MSDREEDEIGPETVGADKNILRRTEAKVLGRWLSGWKTFLGSMRS